MTWTLSDLLARTPVQALRGDPGTVIHGLAYDSREVRPGFLFFALAGLHADGHRYIDAAVAAGAVAVAHTAEPAAYAPGVAYVRVPDSRFAMSAIADAFWGSPSRSLAVVGVTGTEGKSTTVWLAYRLLDLLGRKAGFVSTVEYRVAGSVEPNPEHQTTPEATTIHAKLAAMAANGLDYAVLEASSHGLSELTNRLGDVAFDVGVMTNVRHEHLEFHGTWERYRDDKARLFAALDADVHRKAVSGRPMDVPSFGVVCADDPSADVFRAATSQPVYSYSMRGTAADLMAVEVRDDDRGASFVIRDGKDSYPARIELPGAFNVENVLAAVLVVSRLTGETLETIVPLLPRLEPVRGRMTRVDRGQPFEVLVDYAHTPTSFETILPPLRARVKGRILCVFGSGGERDTLKRPEQGRIAARYCDIVILSDEDPRGEDPLALLEDIAAGCGDLPRGERLFLIPDRAAAIRKAMAMAQPGDVVLLLGKGHENTIIYSRGSSKTIPWNEIEEARTALAEAGYRD